MEKAKAVEAKNKDEIAKLISDAETYLCLLYTSYRGDDTFIGTLRTGLEDKAKEYEQETGIKVKLDIMDAKGSQNTQNSQVERLISLGCDALCINSVDRSSCLLYTSRCV